MVSNLSVDLSKVQKDYTGDYKEKDYCEAILSAMRGNSANSGNVENWQEAHHYIAQEVARFYHDYVDENVGVLSGKKCLINCRSQEEARIQAQELNKLFDDHLSQFKNNKVNVPYIRTLGNKKYWFVNGKNTGAIAQYDYSDPTYIITETIKELITQIYTKSQIDAMLQNYCTISQHDNDQNLLMYNIMREINQIKSAIGLTE
jgi:hypothetical protein